MHNHITAICRIGHGVLTDAPGPIAVKIEQALRRVLREGDDRLVQVQADLESGLTLVILRSPNASGCDASLEGARRGGFLHAAAIEGTGPDDDWSEGRATLLFESRYGSPLLEAAIRQERELLFLALPADGVAVAHLFVGDAPDEGGALYGAGADACAPTDSPTSGLSSLLTSAGSAPAATSSFPSPPRGASPAGASAFAPSTSRPEHSATPPDEPAAPQPPPAVEATPTFSASPSSPTPPVSAAPTSVMETPGDDAPRLSSLLTSLGSAFSPHTAPMPVDPAPDPSQAAGRGDAQMGVVVPFPAVAVARQLEVEPESLPFALRVVEDAADADESAFEDTGEGQSPDVTENAAAAGGSGIEETGEDQGPEKTEDAAVAEAPAVGRSGSRVLALAASLLLLVILGSVAGIYGLRPNVLEQDVARETPTPAGETPPAVAPPVLPEVPAVAPATPPVASQAAEPRRSETIAIVEPADAAADEVLIEVFEEQGLMEPVTVPVVAAVAPPPRVPIAEPTLPATSPVPRPIESVSIDLAPTAVASEPVAEPVAEIPTAVELEPESVATKPTAVAVEPEPVETAPTVVAVEPEPVETAPKAVPVEPEPAFVTPTSVAVEPEAAKPPPLAGAPEPIEALPTAVALEPKPLAGSPTAVAVAREPAAASSNPAVAESVAREPESTAVAIAPESSPLEVTGGPESVPVAVSVDEIQGAGSVTARAVVAAIVEPAGEGTAASVDDAAPDVSLDMTTEPVLPAVSSGIDTADADSQPPVTEDEEPRQLEKKRKRLMRRLKSYR